MNVLITGGAGFIGANMALRLVRDGHSVTVLDVLSPQIHGNDPDRSSPLYGLIKGRVNFVRGSVCDESALGACLGLADAVVHLAAETGTGQSMYEINRYVENNVGGTALMLDWLANHSHNVRRIVVASSRAIYGEGKYQASDGKFVYPAARRAEDLQAGHFDPVCSDTGLPLLSVPTDEESKIHPSSVYGITKQNQEQMVMVVSPSIGIEPVALRYQNVYGPGQSLKNPYTGILSIFSTCILNGRSINIFEDGKESRDFVYIDDVVEATCLALYKDEAAGHVFGIGSGVRTDVLTVARSLIEQYKSKVPVQVTGAFRIGDIRHNYADMTKARRMLGFEPTVDFKVGVERFSRWVNEQSVSEDNYLESLNEMATRGLLKQ